MVDQPPVPHKDIYPGSDNNSNDSKSTYIESPNLNPPTYDTDDCIVWEANCEPWTWDCSTSFVADTKPQPSCENITYESWLVDSGATVHITNDKSHMFNKKTTENHVTIGDGSKIVGRLQGSLLLHTTSNHKVKLNHVLYLPGFNRNILSMARLLEHGNEIMADSDSLALIKGATRLTLLKETKGGMFSLQATRLAPNPWTSVHLADSKSDHETAPKTTDINEAHDKLGHAHEDILKRTCKKLNITLTGQLLPCDACMRTKAQAKPVKKTTDTKATYVGERLFLDTSGPFPPSIKGSRYWGKICDQHSGKTWDSFLKKKSQIPETVENLLITLKAKGHKVKYLRCDNAGEHEEKLQKICQQLGVQLEYTSPNTPQYNGVVERRFVTDRNRAMAMMTAANWTDETKNLLRCEAISTASKLGDLLIKPGKMKSAHEEFHGKPSPLIPHLVEFGRIGYVTKRDTRHDYQKMDRKIGQVHYGWLCR